MAPLETVVVPDLGDVDEVDVVEVLVSAGDRIAKEDPLITLESDKASMDVPSPAAGTVTEVMVKAGDKVSAGSKILSLERAKEEEAPAPSKPAEPEPEAARPAPAASPPEKAPVAAPETTPAQAPAPERAPPAAPPAETAAPMPRAAGAYASPAVRRFARELGVDLNRVTGSGRKGRILKEDVQAHVQKTLAAPAAAGAFALPEMPPVDFSKFGEVERVAMSRIRRISAENLHRAWLHVPHVTQHDEADVTELEAFRKAHAEEAAKQGFKLTPVAFVMKAVAAALAKFPTVNSSLDADGETLILKKYCHLGVAVDTEDGLLVPVVRDADRKGLFQLASELADLSARAREKKLKPDEMRGGCFTITSLGGIGGTAFTPIVNAPEVAILGVSRARLQPVWDGESFEPRLMLPVSLSYDHRVIDGALAVRFTTYLCSLLADLRRLLL